MKSFVRTPFLAIVAGAFGMLAGCASPPALRVEALRVPGVVKQTFQADEIPAVMVDAWDANTAGVRVRRVPDGLTVVRSSAPHPVMTSPEPPQLDAEGNPIHIEVEPAPHRFVLGRLPSGSYIAEVWQHGRMDASTTITIVGANGATASAPVVLVAEPWRMPTRRPNDFPADEAVQRAMDELTPFAALSAAQEKRIRQILSAEYDALHAARASSRMADVGATQHAARARIMAVLTPSQRAILGDDGSAERELRQLQQRVTLSQEQQAQAARVFLAEFQQLALLTPEDEAAGRDREIRQSARAQIRTLLTPDQQSDYEQEAKLASADAGAAAAARSAPGHADLNDAQSQEFLRNTPRDTGEYIKNYLQHSAAMATRVGHVTQVDGVGGPFTFGQPRDGQTIAMDGHFDFDVKGSKRSEIVTVFWRKRSPSDPVQVIRIQTRDGEVIGP